MKLANTHQTYGWVSIALHWGMALIILGLFPLGLYMTELDYYHPWYQLAPHIHRSIGILLLLLLLFRLCWRVISPPPQPVGGDSRWLQRIAELAHWGLYLLLLAIALSGYLISTADGRGVDVFDWFTVPALIPGFPNMEDVAGAIHLTLAIIMMGLVGLHAMAALKHHFVDRDRTLLRMFGRSHQQQPGTHTLVNYYSKENI
ncbi:cytochrome b [Sedimenticola sp.]|uniref:cytochrome b n=1 Tax=Sedimenticola sp. TaxID=1940285 RepID=UPI003D0EAFE8